MKISLDDLSFHGKGLSRPECVLAHKSGLLFAPCWIGNGGVSVVSAAGRTSHILANDVSNPLKPNGIALEAGGSFLLAHMGAKRGAIIRLFSDGRTEVVTDTVDGAPMPPVNFVTLDRQGRLWITVSTRVTPRADDYRKRASTGFIAIHENNVTRIVADGLGYTNEVAFSADEKTVWVNETFARRTSAFSIDDNAVLSKKVTTASYEKGTFPDGLAPDSKGGVWVTSIISNRVIHLDGQGGSSVVLEDSDAEHLDWVEQAFQTDALGREHLDKSVSSKLHNISNIAFGGPDLRTAYLGCLLGDQIASFESPVAGLALPHWDADLGPLERYLEGS